MTLTLTILGCGSSGGVPRVGGDWGICNPDNPRNRRRRCSVLLEQHGESGVTRVVIDTSPDMREQMLSAEVSTLDGVWYTHEHADHTHGIDELRGFYLLQRHRIPIWADSTTAEMLTTRFSYCFTSLPGSDYPPVLSLHGLKPGAEVSTTGAGGTLRGMPFRVNHGNIDALGFRVGRMAYTPDIKDVPTESHTCLEGLDLWIIDALRPRQHPSHFSLGDALDWIERMKPRRAVLTNMHNDMDYDQLVAKLPPNVTPAFDGMKVDI